MNRVASRHLHVVEEDLEMRLRCFERTLHGRLGVRDRNLPRALEPNLHRMKYLVHISRWFGADAEHLITYYLIPSNTVDNAKNAVQTRRSSDWAGKIGTVARFQLDELQRVRRPKRGRRAHAQTRRHTT